MCFINGENLKDLPVGLNSNRSVSAVNTSAFSSMNSAYYIYALFKMIVKTIKTKLEKRFFKLIEG